MIKIKTFKKFNEEISGTEMMPGRPRIQGIDSDGANLLGPNYGQMVLPNTINTNKTSVIYSDITSKIYTSDDFEDLYNDYLKVNGTPLDGGFTKDNLEKVLTFKPQI